MTPGVIPSAPKSRMVDQKKRVFASLAPTGAVGEMKTAARTRLRSANCCASSPPIE